jgi:hypothetical protein
MGALSHYVFCDSLLGYKPAPAKDYIGAVVDMIITASTPARKARAARR